MPIVDFAILTGLTEEFAILRKLFPELAEDPDNSNGEEWYRGRVLSEGGVAYEIVASFQTQKGPLGAHALTASLVRRWDPAYIILVGIAGTFDKDVKLGDVIVSQQIFYYDPGKAVGGEIQYRPEGYPCSATLIRQAAAVSLDPRLFPEWQQLARRSAREKAAGLSESVVLYRPGGNHTMPPPAAAHASIAPWVAAVSSVLPSPLAPYDFTFWTRSFISLSPLRLNFCLG